MNTKKIITLLYLSSVAIISVNAQETTTSSEKKIRKMKFGSIMFNPVEFYANNETFGGLGKIYRTSSIPFPEQIIEEGHSWYVGDLEEGYIKATAFSYPTISASLHPYSRAKGSYNLNREFRVGFSVLHQEQDAEEIGMKISIDTISGVDTSFRITNQYREVIKYPYIELSYLYKTDPDKRVSGYVGFGIKAGSSYSQTLIRDQFYDMTVEKQDTSFNTYHETQKGLGYISETFHVASSWMIQPYIPFGINFRISESNRFLNRCNVYLEAKAGINYQHFNLPKERFASPNFMNPFCSITMGLRYNFMK